MTFFDPPKDYPVVSAWMRNLAAVTSKFRQSRETLSTKRTELKKLRGKFSDEEIDKVLSWYVIHIGEQFVPQAYSVKNFCTKFEQLQAAMTRTDGTRIEVESWVLDLVTKLQNDFSWPVQIEAKLPQIAQLSHKAIREFITLVSNYRSATGRDRESSFLLSIQLYNFPILLDSWLMELSNSYGKIPSWTGDVMNLVFDPKSQRFKELFWWKWSREWCGVPTAFDELLEKVLKENVNG